MKKISAIVMVLGLIFITLLASAQISGRRTENIVPERLGVAFSKTTNIVFPYTIVGVDRGSSDVLAQKAKGAENILQVKAARQGFRETNLTVITSDGILYSYILNFTENPDQLNIKYAKGEERALAMFSNEAEPNQAELETNSKRVAGEKRSIRGVKDKRYGIKFLLEGIYIKDAVMYFQFSLKNTTNINYDIDQLRFYIRDQEKSQRTASQEIELKPLYTYNSAGLITGGSENVFVIAVPKFTVPDKKELLIQVMEKNGGRHVELTAGNKKLVRAISL